MKRSTVLIAMLASLATVPAHATLVTFDDAAGQAATGGYGSGESFSDGGLTFTYGASSTAFMQLWDASSYGAAAGSNGTNTLLVGASATDSVTITATNGGEFSLSSLLLGINEPAVAAETADSVLVNGTKLNITNTASLYTVSTGNVFAVTISGLVNGGYVSVDNLTYQVPEPASLAVLAIGLAGMTAASRRKRRS